MALSKKIIITTAIIILASILPVVFKENSRAEAPKIKITTYIQSGVSGVDEASYRAFIQNINQLYATNSISVNFSPEWIGWYNSGESCGSDFHGNNVIMCVGPEKGGFMGPPYLTVGANTNAPYGFTTIGIRAEAHELAHFLGFQDLYWLKTQTPLVAPSIVSTDIMMDPYNLAGIFGDNVSYIINMNIQRLNSRQSVLYPISRTANKLNIQISGASNQDCSIHTRTRDYNYFNSKINATPNLVKKTDGSGIFQMGIVGGDSADNNFDVYYISCGLNNFWLSSLESENCFKENGANSICSIRCSNPNNWCLFNPTPIITPPADTTPPTNTSIVIAGGTATTANTAVVLTLAATDASQMMISNSSDFSEASWETYAVSKNWTLTSGDGVKTVYVKFKDAAGNISTAASDSITLLTTDTTPPTNTSIVITSGAATTASASVTLTLAATDATQMMISNNANFTGPDWEVYTTSKSWTLTIGDGAKTVYAKFRDASGNVSTAVSDSITLSTVTPATPATPATPVIPTTTPTTPTTTTATTPTTSAVSYPDGTLLKSTTDPKVYVIKDGEKVWIETAAKFNAAGYKWTEVKTVSAEVIKQVGVVTLLRAEGDHRVYVVKNNIRRHIPNTEIFFDYGFDWSDIKSISQSTLDQYKQTRLIKESYSSQIYYLSSNGIKKWIPTAEIFSSYENKWEDIQIISKKEIENYKESNLMRYNGKIYLIQGTYKKLIPTEAVLKRYDTSLILDANSKEFNWYRAGSAVK